MDAKMEANECLNKAEKYLKTSILKWKPDFDSASSAYERAAVCFKNARELDPSIEAYVAAADCYEKNGNLFHAAKCKEQASFGLRDKRDFKKAKELAEAAGQLYMEAGSVESAAMVFEKAGRFLESFDLELALQLYHKGVNALTEVSQSRLVSQLLDRISKVNLKMGRYNDVCESLNQAVRLYQNIGDTNQVGRLTFCIVLTRLLCGDLVEAAKVCHGTAGCQGSVHEPVMRCLVSACEERNFDQIKQLLASDAVRIMDNEYVKLAQKVLSKYEKETGSESLPLQEQALENSIEDYSLL